MPAFPCCCFYCCSAVINDTGDPCLFSSDSYLSVSITSTLVGFGNAAFIALVNYMNTYWAANPTFTIKWNTHQVERCDGQYDAAGINGYWVKQIGTLSGYPVWVYNTALDTGRWAIGFSNSTLPGGSGGGPNAGVGVSSVLDDTGGGTCAGTSETGRSASGCTGTADFTITVENNGCEDEGI